MAMQVDYVSTGDKLGDHFVLVTGVDANGEPINHEPGSSQNRGVPVSQVKTHQGYPPLRVLYLE